MDKLEKLRRFLNRNITSLQYFFAAWLVCAMLAFKSCEAQDQHMITKSEVYDYIVASDIYERHIVYKQVLKETGMIKCNDCSLDHNNLFGFRYKHRYLEFDTWEESIDYYERWQLRKGYVPGENYFEFLERKWGAPKMLERYIPNLKAVKLI